MNNTSERALQILSITALSLGILIAVITAGVINTQMDSYYPDESTLEIAAAWQVVASGLIGFGALALLVTLGVHSITHELHVIAEKTARSTR